MARGQPDYGQNAAQQNVSGVSDLGELAARINSVVTFDRRGLVAFFDDFEGSHYRHVEYGNSLHGQYIHSRDYMLSGSQSLLVRGYNAAAAEYGIQYRLALMSTLSSGVKISVMFPEHAFDFVLGISHRTGLNEYSGLIKYDWSEGAWRLTYGASQWAAIWSTFQHVYTPGLFNHIKLVLDYDNLTYKRFIFNCLEYDISAYPLVQSTNTFAYHDDARMTVQDQYGEDCSMYIDDFVYTVDEP